MKHVHSLRFETLEGRELLSTAHVARAVGVPLVLNGTLSVYDPQAASSMPNSDGSSTMAIPVTGQLGTLGPVHGFWNVTVDSLGDREGLDTLSLRDAKGTFTVEFNNLNSTPSKAKARGAISHEHTQMLSVGTGAYARATERGTIVLTSNASQTQVVSLTLHTKNS
jgi:hypothetical protein